MKLIAEVYDYVKPLVEATKDGKKIYAIEGVFLQAEVKNRNGRTYPMAVLQREVARYNEEYVKQNRALGELGHPESPHINLERVSHMITKLEANGVEIVGRPIIKKTPYGKIVKSFIDEGVKFGVSSRGVGSLENAKDGDVVADDFFLATAADIVADPSAPQAFVRGLREQNDWVWDNGTLSTARVQKLQTTITKAPVKTRSQARALETRIFETFMRELKRGTQVS